MLFVRAELSRAVIGIMFAFGWRFIYVEVGKNRKNIFTSALWFNLLDISAPPPYQDYKSYNEQQIKERRPVPNPVMSDLGMVTTYPHRRHYCGALEQGSEPLIAPQCTMAAKTR